MIIFTRWGFIPFLFIGVGVGIGFVLQTLLTGSTGSTDSGDGIWMGLGWMVSAVGLWFLSRNVIERHLDKPKPLTITERLAQPYVHPNGATQHYQTIPLLHPQTGEQMWSRPSSSLFFIPVRFWPFVLGGGGLLMFIVSTITSLF